MKIVCNVSIGNRLLSSLAINSKRKHVKSTLALCKNPKSDEFCIILFNASNKNGTKYNIKNNIKQVLTRFVNEGKATIQLKQPEHDLFLQADVIQLKGFLHLLKRALENKITEKEFTYSSMSVTAVAPKDIAPKKLIITSRADYPVRGLPRTLETLVINGINRSSLDKGILHLVKLKVLDLSNNLIEVLPEEFSKLPCLAELNISENRFDKSSPMKWSWLGGNLSKTLLLLDISKNNLKFVPPQVIKLHKLLTLNLSNNNISSLPSGLGNLRNLKMLNVSHNTISELPGSIKMVKLQSLDLSNNNFDPNYQNNVLAVQPKPLPVLSLKEIAAKKTLDFKQSYGYGTIPLTLIDFLDYGAKYCVCGKACFSAFFKQQHMLSLSSISEFISMSDRFSYVPVNCYFCSLTCFGRSSYNRQRAPIVR